MKLLLDRTIYTGQSTIGELSIDGKFQCYTLEDTVRQPEIKVPGMTAIPSGAYELVLTISPRFKRVLPRLLNVPKFEGILIHPGNDSGDTEGCILVGRTKAKDFIGESVLAFKELFLILDKAYKSRESITIVVNDNYATPPSDAKPATSKPVVQTVRTGKGAKS